MSGWPDPGAAYPRLVSSVDVTEIDWAGTYRFQAPVLRPASIAEVQEVVRSHDHVRALGTRHTFNGLADSPGVLVETAGVDPAIEVDADARTVTVGAGTQFGTLARELDRQGWALFNLGSLPHISVAGAVATGTHGSGNSNPVLASAVRAIEYVDADGELRTVRAGDEHFEGMVVALGAYGVVVRMTLAIEPAYQVRQDVYRGMPWSALDDWASVQGSGYSVSGFTLYDPVALGHVWVKRRVDQLDGDVPDSLVGATRDPVSADWLTEDIRGNVTVQGGEPGPWWQRLPHFRFDAMPSNGDEIQSEYFVERSRTAEAIAAVKGVADRFRDLIMVGELRSAAADDLWLSPAFGRDTGILHFTWHKVDEVYSTAVPAVEEALAGLDARPHWGKVNGYDAAAMERAYPNLPRARALFDSLDPAGKFSSPMLERWGVRSPR